MPHDNLFCCPSCGETLQQVEAGPFGCPQCAITFPLLAETIPVLVPDPQKHLAGEQLLLTNEAAQYQATGEYYRDAAKRTNIRRATLNALGEGLIFNAGLLRSFAKSLPTADVQVERHAPPLGADIFAALRKDWSGLNETEAELRIAHQAICDIMRQSPPERTLVLGAGVGRTMCELDAVFSNVYGIDLSVAMVLSYARLCREGNLDAFLLHQGNFLQGDQECERVVAQRERAGGEPCYLLADAAKLPFANSSFDAIVMNYFTDMVPLSVWLGEARRVLREDGRMIHFGPLGYAFAAIEEHYAVDQLPTAFQQHGLAMSTPQRIRTSFHANNRRLNRFDIDNLLFTLRVSQT